jgi:Mrp family chromosome partitioning ATPase
MSRISDALRQVDSEGSPVPVILPLRTRGQEDRGAADEQNAAAVPSAEPAAEASAALRPSYERFRFPQLPAPLPDVPATTAVRADWPECSDTETLRACAATAEEMLREWPLSHPTVVGLTSPVDGDGKTSLLLGLAPQLAKQVARSILAVDAHRTKPDLTAQLRLPASPTSARAPLIYPTNLPRLHVLPASAGQAKAKPLASLGDPLWFEDLREGWPLVLLDMASLVHPEAAALARGCDGVYLVVRLGHTPRRAITEAARVLRDVGGQLLGCLVIG